MSETKPTEGSRGSDLLGTSPRVFIPLNPRHPKRPHPELGKGWSEPDYLGVDPNTYVGPLALRCDDIVVVDLDTVEAAREWHRRYPEDTFTRRTPRGFHLVYWQTPGSPDRPAVDVLPHTDIRAGRRSYIVWRADGYENLDDREPLPWISFASTDHVRDVDVQREGWDSIPEGQRNELLFKLACWARGRGASDAAITHLVRAVNTDICDPALSDLEVARVAASASRYDPNAGLAGPEEATVSGIRLLDPTEVEFPGPVAWLLEPLIIDGVCSLVEGREGVGKGLFCALLAAQVASGQLGGKPKPVLWASSEDDPVRVVYPRLLAAGWDPKRHAEVLFFHPDERVALPGDIKKFTAQLDEREWGLVVLDPVKSLMGPAPGFRVSGNDDSYVRHFFEPVCQLAQARDLAVVAVGHWNKGGTDREDQDRSLGSVAWRAVPRGVVAAQWIGSTDGGEGALALVKSNVAPTGRLQSYAIEQVTVQIEDHTVPTARLVLDAPLPETSLKQWADRVRREQGAEIEVVSEEGHPTNVQVVLDAARRELTVGEKFWTKEKLAVRFGLSQEATRSVFTYMREQSWIVQKGGGPYQWQGE